MERSDPPPAGARPILPAVCARAVPSDAARPHASARAALPGAALLALALLASPAAAVQANGGARDTTLTATDTHDARMEALATPSAGTPAHSSRAPRARAVHVPAVALEVDGRLEEPAWSEAPAIDRFVQREPREGEPATQRTEVRFVHDGSTLYVGARMFDDRGAEGVTARLVRRDGEADADLLELTFDAFHDHLTQIRFTINPAGVRGDAYGPGGSNPDPSWDPIWHGEARVDAEGWTAELAIPFSQLRFPRDSGAVWGLQVSRTVKRLNEVSVWSFWGLDESGGPSRYGHLEGLTEIEAAATRLEILPYAVTLLERNGTAEEGNPFRDDVEGAYRLGADLTYLLSSNLTLNATVNPDFGQVEVDPAVVNLSAFETFFEEKREFFIQGRGRFGFGSFWCMFCSNVSSLSMLHTRRIGRTPQGAFLADGAGEHADIPSPTTILGAAKITGQTTGGTSLGILGAVTARERADVLGFDGSRFRQEIEPASGYFVSRVKQDFLDGELQVGGILTGVYRDFEDPGLESMLNRHSEGVGLDAEYWWGDHTYHFLFSTAFTNIAGTEEAILRAQRSSARYFQRPDREHGGNGLFTDRLDPDLTSMRGWGLYSRIAKDAGDWKWETALNVRSPGFENNDIAFLTRTDFVWMGANVSRSWTEPTSWYRGAFATLGGQQQFNFDGDLTDRQLHGFLHVETPFYWNFVGFLIARPPRLDDRLSRGGPVLERPATFYAQAEVGTDSRKPFIFGTFPSFGWNTEGGTSLSIPLNLTVKPASNVRLTLSPTYSRERNTDQFVTSVDDPTAEAFYGRRYVFADLHQESVSMPVRLAWTFNPEMSLELYAQPLISANDFLRFKEFAAPREVDKLVYGRDVGTVRSEGEGDARRWLIDPDGAGPADEFSFGERDFVFRSLRGNLVFRWEWRPGSTLYFVWTQDRFSDEPFGDFSFDRDAGALFEAPGDDVFLVKLTWWLGI